MLIFLISLYALLLSDITVSGDIFNMPNYYFVHAESTYVFCMALKKIISLRKIYVTVFIAPTERVYCSVGNENLSVTQCNSLKD